MLEVATSPSYTEQLIDNQLRGRSPDGLDTGGHLPFTLGTRLERIRTYSPHLSHSRPNLSTASSSSLLPSLTQYIELTLEQFCNIVDDDDKVGSATILRMTTYVLRSNGVPHRFVILLCEIPSLHGDDDPGRYYVRIYRRPDRRSSRRMFVKRLGHAPAGDSVVIGRTIDSVLSHTKPKEESQITFPVGEQMKLLQLAIYLRVIVTRMDTYTLLSENCWLLASLVQEYVAQYSGNHRKFDFGRLSFSWLAVPRREELRTAARYAHHLPMEPASTSAILQSLKDQISTNSIHWHLRVRMKIFSLLNGWKANRRPEWTDDLSQPLTRALDVSQKYDCARIRGNVPEDLTKSLAEILDEVRLRLFNKSTPQDILAVSTKLFSLYEALDPELVTRAFFYLTDDSIAFESPDGSLDYIWRPRGHWAKVARDVPLHEVADVFAHVCSLRPHNARIHAQAADFTQDILVHQRDLGQTREQLESAAYLAGTALHLARVAESIGTYEDTPNVLATCLEEYARILAELGGEVAMSDACVAAQEAVEVRYRLFFDGDKSNSSSQSALIKALEVLSRCLSMAARIEDAVRVAKFTVSACKANYRDALNADLNASEAKTERSAKQDVFNRSRDVVKALTEYVHLLQLREGNEELESAREALDAWNDRTEIAKQAWYIS